MADINEEEEGEVKSEAVLKTYRDRLKILRKAQEYSQADDIPKAVECYGQYLNALAVYFGCEESQINPALFNPETDLAELLLISQAYWNLAKAYDRSPNLHVESIRCLDQFAKFTIGFKYQYGNAQLLKNFIRKRQAHNPKAFKQTYERIQIESKGCFIATDLYGENHIYTQNLREFKKLITPYRSGQWFAEFYYQTLCPIYFRFLRPLRFLIKPLITLLARISWKRNHEPN